MVDCIKPENPEAFCFADFIKPLQLPISGVFFNILFNLNKFLSFEQRDPFQSRAAREFPDLNMWDRYARFEYARLAAAEEQRELEDSVNSMGWDDYDGGS